MCKKPHLRVAVGWMIKSKDGIYKQVRASRGGGTRKLDLPRNSSYSDILTKLKELFNINDEECKLITFDGKPLSDEFILEDEKLYVNRVYIGTSGSFDTTEEEFRDSQTLDTPESSPVKQEDESDELRFEYDTVTLEDVKTHIKIIIEQSQEDRNPQDVLKASEGTIPVYYGIPHVVLYVETSKKENKIINSGWGNSWKYRRERWQIWMLVEKV